MSQGNVHRRSICHNRTPSPSYVDRNTSIQSRLIYTREDGKVIMKGDNSTWLEHGVHRPRCVSSAQNLLPFVTLTSTVSGYRVGHSTTRVYLSWILIKSPGVVVSWHYISPRYLILNRYIFSYLARVLVCAYAATHENGDTYHLVQASRKRPVAKRKNMIPGPTLPILTDSS